MTKSCYFNCHKINITRVILYESMPGLYSIGLILRLGMFEHEQRSVRYGT